MGRSMVFLAAALGFAGPALTRSGPFSPSDKEDLTEDRRGATHELRSAKLAVSKASREDVKSYAQKLVHDNAALEKLAGNPSPSSPSTRSWRSPSKLRTTDVDDMRGA